MPALPRRQRLVSLLRRVFDLRGLAEGERVNSPQAASPLAGVSRRIAGVVRWAGDGFDRAGWRLDRGWAVR